jgi:AraC-like DNA-binding protein
MMNGLLRGMSLQLNYIGTYYFPEIEVFYVPPHNHDNHIELMLIETGYGTFEIGGESYQVSPNSLIIYNTGVWHEESGHTIKTHYIGFSNYTSPYLPDGVFFDKPHSSVIPLGEHFDAIKNRFNELKACYEKYQNDAFGIVAGLFIVFLSEIISLIDPVPLNVPTTSGSHIRIVEIKRYLEEHYNETFSLDHLSNLFFLDKFHLCRIFKRQIGMGPNQYVVNYRIEAAKNYLRTTKFSIEMIANKVGYQSVTHFQNMFKTKTGITPGQYRNTN